jgi:hypothetical protein
MTPTKQLKSVQRHKSLMDDENETVAKVEGQQPSKDATTATETPPSPQEGVYIEMMAITIDDPESTWVFRVGSCYFCEGYDLIRTNLFLRSCTDISHLGLL